jgi:predicted nuclease of restriction endonuclease-like (RecB) superfamily
MGIKKSENIGLSAEYGQFLRDLKTKIANAQMRAARAANTELISLYWHIGQQIIHRQNQTKWGAKFIEKLSLDLQNEFPGMRGFSVRNLERMRFFARLYPSDSIATQAVTQLPWGHIVVLIYKIKDESMRAWYAAQTLENGWSRSILEIQISLNLYDRQGKLAEKTTNFKEMLPAPQSDLAQQSLKDPYIFDFLTTGKNAQEREIEKELTTHITKFLLELGTGFAFVGRQVEVKVGDQTFRIDMLFYHLKLKCYVVIELKARQFKPADAGQLNFYLTAVDEKIKQVDDNPTIGILLCKSRNRVIAEYALRNVSSPIGISEYQLTRMMPKDLKTSLPTIEEIEQELSADLAEGNES